MSFAANLLGKAFARRRVRVTLHHYGDCFLRVSELLAIELAEQTSSGTSSSASQKNTALQHETRKNSEVQNSTATVAAAVAIELVYTDGNNSTDIFEFVGWRGDVHSGDANEIRIDAAFARCLCLQNAFFQEVVLDVCPTINPAHDKPAEPSIAYVEPASADDWEIVEENADHLARHLLDQIAVLPKTARFPVRVGSSTVFLRASNQIADDSSNLRPVFLGVGTEVAISARPRQRAQSKSDKNGSLNMLARLAYCSKLPPKNCFLVGAQKAILVQEQLVKITRLDSRLKSEPEQTSKSSSIQVKENLKSIEAELRQPDFETDYSSTKEVDFLSTGKTALPLCLCVNQALASYQCALPCLMVSRDIAEALQPCFYCDEQKENLFEFGKYGVLVSVNTAEKQQDMTKCTTQGIPSNSMASLIHGKLVQEAMENIFRAICRNAITPTAFFVTGPRGSGRTRFLKNVVETAAKQFSTFSVFIHGALVSSKLKLSQTNTNLADCFSRAAAYAPSIIAIDDADILLPGPKSNEENSAGNRRTDAAAAAAAKLVCHYLSSVPCILLLACERLDIVSKSFVSCFQVCGQVALGLKTESERFEIVQWLARNLENDEIKFNLDVDAIVKERENMLLKDYEIVFNRAILAATSRAVPSTVSTQDVLEALGAHTLLNAESTASGSAGLPAWDTVCGLTEAKLAIEQAVFWPTKYADLYKKLGCDPGPGGVLLYGYPGCGKTMLALAVCSRMRHIIVRAAELLDKYIGGSEARVRGVFERARASAPCVVVLDEVDAIAPRRNPGSNSATGDQESGSVTDRVVNQLLAELDGVYSRLGVHVIATTTRPDRIDPAVLRPGRISKHVLCGLPDSSTRKEILMTCVGVKSISSQAKAAAAEIASLADGYSGADVRGIVAQAIIESERKLYSTITSSTAGAESNPCKELLSKNNSVRFYNAEIDIIEVAKSSPKDSKVSLNAQEPSELTAEHLHRGFELTRPSLSSSYVAGLKKQYTEFCKNTE